MGHRTEITESGNPGWFTATCDCGWKTSGNNRGELAMIAEDHSKWQKEKQVPAISADLNADYDSLAKENRRLTELNKDLHQQNTELRASKLLSPAEADSIAQLRRDYDRVNTETNKLAKWLSDNKAKEIKQGKHMGMSLSEVVIMYMAKGLVD